MTFAASTTTDPVIIDITNLARDAAEGGDQILRLIMDKDNDLDTADELMRFRSLEGSFPWVCTVEYEYSRNRDRFRRNTRGF